MSLREQYLHQMRVAGYHDDRAEFTRLLISSRINRREAYQAFWNGEDQKKAGIKCACNKCNKPG